VLKKAIVPVNKENRIVINREYPRYKTLEVKPPKDSFDTQKSKECRKT